jgi:hypothetical protein
MTNTTEECRFNNKWGGWKAYLQAYHNGRYFLYCAPEPAPIAESNNPFFRPRVFEVLTELERAEAVRDQTQFEIFIDLLPKDVFSQLKKTKIQASRIAILEEYDPRFRGMTEKMTQDLLSILFRRPGRPPKRRKHMHDYINKHPEIVALALTKQMGQAKDTMMNDLYPSLTGEKKREKCAKVEQFLRDCVKSKKQKAQ